MTKNNTQLPRGLRNNNPLNIRIGNTWLGEVAENTDGQFEQFTSMEYGVRAAAVLLRRYINHYHLKTITEIISRWAPASENATLKYIDLVSKLTGFSPFLPLHFCEDDIVPLLDAMIFVECGKHIPVQTIKLGFQMA